MRVDPNKELEMIGDDDRNDVVIPKPNFVIQPVENLPGGGDVHESFNIDSQGNISGGHTKVRLPGGTEAQIDWNE